jgi:hypothetical protein
VRDIVKSRAKRRGKKHGTRILLFGPDEKVAKAVEINESKARDITVDWRNAN